MKGWWTNEEGDKNAHIKLSFARYEYTDGEITDILEEVAIWYSNQRFGKFEIGLARTNSKTSLMLWLLVSSVVSSWIKLVGISRLPDLVPRRRCVML